MGSAPSRLSGRSRLDGEADWEWSGSSSAGDDSGGETQLRPPTALQLRRSRRKSNKTYEEFDSFVEERVPLSEELPAWCRTKVAKVVAGILVACLLAGAVAAAAGVLPAFRSSLHEATQWTLGSGSSAEPLFPEGVDPAGPPAPPAVEEGAPFEDAGAAAPGGTAAGGAGPRRLAAAAPSAPPPDAAFFDPLQHVCRVSEWDGVVRSYFRHWGPGTVTPHVLSRVPPQGWGARVQVLGGGEEIRFQVERHDALWGDAVPRVLLELRQALRLWRAHARPAAGAPASGEGFTQPTAPYEPIPDVDIWLSGSPGPVEVPPPVTAPSKRTSSDSSASVPLLEESLYPPVLTLKGSPSWNGVHGVPIPHPALGWRVPADPKLEGGNYSIAAEELLAAVAAECHPRRHPLARKNWEFAVSRGAAPLSRDAEVLRASDAGLESIVDVRSFFQGSRFRDSLVSLCEHAVIVDTSSVPVTLPPPAPGSALAVAAGQEGSGSQGSTAVKAPSAAAAHAAAIASVPTLPWLLASGSVVARFTAAGHTAASRPSDASGFAGASDSSHGGIISDWQQVRDFPELAATYAAGARYSEVGEYYTPLLAGVTYHIGSPKAAKPFINALLAHATADRRAQRQGPAVPLPAMQQLVSRARGFALQHFSPPGVLCYWRVLLNTYAHEILAPGAVVPLPDPLRVGASVPAPLQAQHRPTLSLPVEEPLHSHPDVELAKLHVAYLCTGAAGLPSAAAGCAAAQQELAALEAALAPPPAATRKPGARSLL